jgi:hypothetical protein
MGEGESWWLDKLHEWRRSHVQWIMHLPAAQHRVVVVITLEGRPFERNEG